MTYLEISGWEEYQTFRKDRGCPPWIKLHRSLLTSERWLSLSDSDKGVLVSLWMVGAAKDGKIPADPKVLRRMAQIDKDPNIKRFIELGYLVDNQVSGGCQEVAKLTHQSRVEQSRVEQSRYMACEFFEEDWLAYPRKAGSKAKAKTCYLKSVDTQEKRTNFILKTSLYLSSLDGDLTYCKHGETWFRNWEDHVVDQAPKAKTKLEKDIDSIRGWKAGQGDIRPGNGTATDIRDANRAKADGPMVDAPLRLAQRPVPGGGD